MASRDGANDRVERVVVGRAAAFPRVGLTTRAVGRALVEGVVTRGELADARGATTVVRGAGARRKPER